MGEMPDKSYCGLRNAFEKDFEEVVMQQMYGRVVDNLTSYYSTVEDWSESSLSGKIIIVESHSI